MRKIYTNQRSFSQGSACRLTRFNALCRYINPLPNNKILDVTKLKAFADAKFNVGRMLTSLLDRVENTVGKEENAGYQHFLLFPQCFAKPFSLGSLKVGIVWYRVKVPFIKAWVTWLFFLFHFTTTSQLIVPHVCFQDFQSFDYHPRLTHYQTTNFTLFQIERLLQTTISNLMKSYPNW